MYEAPDGGSEDKVSVFGLLGIKAAGNGRKSWFSALYAFEP